MSVIKETNPPVNVLITDNTWVGVLASRQLVSFQKLASFTAKHGRELSHLISKCNKLLIVFVLR